jgi:uncharacterized protein YjbJ (UPF0337 family)
VPDFSYGVFESSLLHASPLHRAGPASKQHFEKSGNLRWHDRCEWKAPSNLLEWTNMNWDRIEGNWKQFTGKVKEQWGKLTDSDLDLIKGKRDQLVGKIQEQYGISKDEAERQVGEFADRQRDVEKI